jgi:hypothetical protein
MREEKGRFRTVSVSYSWQMNKIISRRWNGKVLSQELGLSHTDEEPEGHEKI